MYRLINNNANQHIVSDSSLHFSFIIILKSMCMKHCCYLFSCELLENRSRFAFILYRRFTVYLSWLSFYIVDSPFIYLPCVNVISFNLNSVYTMNTQ